MAAIAAGNTALYLAERILRSPSRNTFTKYARATTNAVLI
jgi:hypothetical protein